MSARTLVAYFSKGGASRHYAEIVSRVLTAHGHEIALVDLRRDRRPDLGPYDNIVLGTGVRIGRVYRKGRKFLSRSELDGKRLAIFLASGVAVEDAEKSKETFLRPLVRKLGLRPVMCDPLPGLLPGPEGKLEDHTDPDRCRRWAEELAARLATSAAA